MFPREKGRGGGRDGGMEGGSEERKSPKCLIIAGVYQQLGSTQPHTQSVHQPGYETRDTEISHSL